MGLIDQYKRAVERNIEIIGEAMNHILKLEPDIPISDSRRIVDTRNRIIHGYEPRRPGSLNIPHQELNGRLLREHIVITEIKFPEIGLKQGF